jgi:hypothetical protein
VGIQIRIGMGEAFEEKVSGQFQVLLALDIITIVNHIQI